MDGAICRGCIYVAGARPYGMGHMGGAQYTTISGQVNLAHAPPMVRISAWEQSYMLYQALAEFTVNCLLFCLFHAPVEGFRVGTYSLLSLHTRVTLV